MEYIIQVFDNLVNIITTAWSVVVHFFESLGKLMDILISVVTLIYNIASSMPSWLEAFVVGTTIISIAMIIVGREKGKSA